MPTPQIKRDVILKTSVAAATVTQLSFTMDAQFDTAGGASIRWQDASDTDTEEKTKYLMTLMTAGGAEIGQISLRLVGDAQLPSGSSATVSVDRAVSTFDPSATVGAVSLIDQPEASYERIWKQAAKNRAQTEVVDNVVKLDVRVIAEDSYAVTQTLREATDGSLALYYEWVAVGGAPVVTGTVSLSTSVAAGTGYSLGPVRVVDNDPTTGEERVVTRPRPRRVRR